MNTVPFEVRYLDVTWLDRDIVQRLKASIDPIRVDEEEGVCAIATQVFKATGIRIGLRVLGEELVHRPYFLMDQGVREELLAVVDPGNGDTWWIENSGWDPERQRYHSRLQRTVGTARICVQNRLLTIHNHSLNFTTDELGAYLSDFKSDLWRLIFDPRGTVRGEIETGRPSILGEELLHRIREFIGAAERVAAHMEVELKEVVERRPLRSVRPINKTFREVAMRAHARQLSSRGFAEVRDTAVNRYAHHLVGKLKFMVGQLRRMASAQETGMERMAEQQLSWSDEIGSRTHKTVDQEVLRDELDKLEAKLEAVQRSTREQDTDTVSPPSELEGEYTLKLRPMSKSDNRFFYCLELNGDNFEKAYGTYCIVKLPEPIGRGIAETTQNGRRQVRLDGFLSSYYKTDKNGREYHRIDYRFVRHIEFVRPTAADDMRARLEALGAKDWRLALTLKERQEFKHEAKALAARAAMLTARATKARRTRDALDLAERRLNEIERAFRALGVGTSPRLPQSMTYVRNPNYFALKAAYVKLNSLAGTEDDIFDSMQAVEEIGLVNVSNLYEKWCLLQIIKVLRDGFGFEPSDGWQKILLDGVLGRRRDISLTLNGPAGWTATLVYEKVLANNRRPDFVVDLDMPRYAQTELPESRQWFDTGEQEKLRLVMDAKFRERWRRNEIAELLEELCVRKNYAEDECNPFFILHPCAELAQRRTSPLAWGTASDYGQLSDHMRGAIHLSPRRANGSSIDNLHRLFGMIFQRASRFLRGDEGWQWTDALCIGCGRGIDASEVQLKFGTTKTGNERWELTCRACQLVSVRTNCYGCRREIFKNGHHWTYHRTRAESLSNIVCPRCERFFDNPSDEPS